MKSILITSSILILLIAALRSLLRGRIDPRVQYALWLIAVLRLLVPVELAPSAYSALALLERMEKPARVEEAIGRLSLPAQSYDEAYVQAIREYDSTFGQNTNIDQYTAGLTSEEHAMLSARAQEIQAKGPTVGQLIADYARPVWLGGALVMALWFLLVNFRLRRRLRRALPVEVDCPLPVYVTPELPSPCLCGALRPKIYITPAALTDPDRMRHVLAHETTHYRHRDHWWALVRCLCLCLYWFDPLVWWAAAMSRQDCELACDAGAIRRLGEEERLSYGRTLVGMIAAGRCSLLQTATTMTGGKRRVRERVKLIARKPRTVIALALALVLILGLAVGCTFTGAPEKKSPTPMSLPTEALQDRLLDVPEELRPTVKASASETKQAVNNIALVSYWLDEPIEWIDGQSYWLLSVYRWERNLIDTVGWGTWENNDHVNEPFAQDGEYYYTFDRPTDARFNLEDSETFTAAYEAIRAFAVQTVLDTEGVESFDPSAIQTALPRQPFDTLQTRLMTVPEEWRDRVDASPAMGGEVSSIATYWLNDPKWRDLWSGYLLELYRMEAAQIQEKLDQQLWPAVHIFARSGDEYYALIWPSDGRYQDGDALSEEYWSASNTLRDHVIETVLATEGVEPFDPYTTPPHFFSNVKLPPLDPGTYAIEGMDYTLVNSYEQVPEDPEQWYLAGYLPDVPVWMFTRGNGEETMFQYGETLTPIFPYRARYYGGGLTHDGKAPQLMPLEGFGWGPRGVSGPFAVITHVFQGGTDQLLQLTVYDLDTDPVTSYVHDWEPFMDDFNANHQVQLHNDTHSATVTYQGQSVEIQFDEAEWESVQQYDYRVETYTLGYSFNDDGTFNLEMPVNPFTTPYIAVWTFRFTGSGFETTGFRFVETDDAYLYISSPH